MKKRREKIPKSKILETLIKKDSDFILLGKYNNKFISYPQDRNTRIYTSIKLNEDCRISFFFLFRYYIDGSVLADISDITGQIEREEDIKEIAEKFTDYIKGILSQRIVDSVTIDTYRETGEYSISPVDEHCDFTYDFFLALEKYCEWKEITPAGDFIRLDLRNEKA